jgi:hypothetical protein
MPVYAMLAWQVGMVVGWLREPGSSTLEAGPKWGVARAVAPWACLLQFALLWFGPWRQIPTAADRAAGAALVAQLAAVPGPVLVPFHPHLARLGGKPTHAQQMALSDVMRGGDRRVADALDADVRRRLGAREFAAVVVDDEWWRADLDASYVRSRTLFVDEPAVLWPRTGWQTRPREIYEPRP